MSQLAPLRPRDAAPYPTPVDALVRANMATVRRIAWHVHGSCGGLIDVADLVQIGLIALVEAARSTRDGGDAAFASYARTRVRGAMVDEVRRAAPQSRGAMARRQRIARARRRLTGLLGRPPTVDEMAAELDQSVADFVRDEADSASLRFEPIDETYSDQNAAFADDGPDALDQLLRSENSAGLAAAVAQLGERHALVLQLHFVDELNLTEIAAVLGVSTPRVHQIKADALARLRALIA